MTVHSCDRGCRWRSPTRAHPSKVRALSIIEQHDCCIFSTWADVIDVQKTKSVTAQPLDMISFSMRVGGDKRCCPQPQLPSLIRAFSLCNCKPLCITASHESSPLISKPLAQGLIKTDVIVPMTDYDRGSQPGVHVPLGVHLLHSCNKLTLRYKNEVCFYSSKNL